jgi:hypothetical protein
VSSVEIDEERAADLSLADRPVVDSHRPQRPDRWQRHTVHEAPHRIWTRGHGQMPYEPTAGCAAERKGHASPCLVEPIGASCA